jgi:hypothetical protein
MVELLSDLVGVEPQESEGERSQGDDQARRSVHEEGHNPADGNEEAEQSFPA